MSMLTAVILGFSLLGAVDLIIGNKIGIGKEFEKGFSLFCPMAMSMLGMIVLAPAIGEWLTPFFECFYSSLGIDPSIIPASLFANDMGGVQLSTAICKDSDIGAFNAYIVSSMMGCVISFTVPFSLSVVPKERHKELFFGLLCGIVTVPVGCFFAGLLCGLPISALLLDLLPLMIFSVAIGAALLLIPSICIRCFKVLGFIIRAIAIIGLGLAVFTFLTGIELHSSFDTLQNAAMICVNACVTLSGTLPAMFLISKLLKKPLNALGTRLGINSASAAAFLGSLVSNVISFGAADKMDKKGTVLNSAFAVSASFVFGGHLALTMAYDNSYVLPMIAGKLISGASALLLALLIYRPDTSEQPELT